MPYRVEGLPDELFGDSARLGELQIPDLLRGRGQGDGVLLDNSEQILKKLATIGQLARTPAQDTRPAGRPDNLLARLAEGLSLTPKPVISPEALEGLGPEGAETVEDTRQSIGQQKLISGVLALISLLLPGVGMAGLIPAVTGLGSARRREGGLYGEIGSAEERSAYRRAEALKRGEAGRKAEEYEYEKTKRPLERRLLEAQIANTEALAQARRDRDKASADAMSFQRRLDLLMNKRAKLRAIGKDLSPEEQAQARQAYEMYSLSLQRAQNFGAALLGAIAPEAAGQPTGQPPTFEQFLGSGEAAPPPGRSTPSSADTTSSPPAGYTEMITGANGEPIWCIPGTEQCWKR